MTKIHRHEAASTNQPPRKGPMAVATPPSPDQAPMAAPRSSGRKLASMMARLPGVNRAAPTPWMARATIRAPPEGAMAQSSDATANHTTPIRNTRLRPNRSPSDPPRSKNPARVNVYALTVHCSPVRPMPRSVPMRGRAMLTTVLSRNAMPDPRTVARITHRPWADL